MFLLRIFYATLAWKSTGIHHSVICFRFLFYNWYTFTTKLFFTRGIWSDYIQSQAFIWVSLASSGHHESCKDVSPQTSLTLFCSSSAAANSFLILASDSPTYLLRISGPLTICGSLAFNILPMVLAISVLPVPGILIVSQKHWIYHSYLMHLTHW